jgi:hypothetical protein
VTAGVSTHPRLRTLSKSDFKLARTCEAKLYFRENRYPDNREFDPYLALLRDGGYMVEALAKAAFTDGIQLEYGRDPTHDFELTRQHLERERVTLFEATLLWNRRLARADILHKSGNTVRLIEVKAKSFDGAEHMASLASGGRGCFFTKKKPYRIMSDWCEKLEDLTYQVLLLEKLLPAVTVEPYLTLVDKSKRVEIGDVPTLFEIERRDERVHTARYTGDRALLPRLDILTQVSVADEVAFLREAVEEAATLFENRLDAPLSEFNHTHGSHCRECEFRIEELEHNGFRECWGDLADTKPHVLELFSVGTVKASDGSGLVEWMVKAGKASLFDVPEDRLVKADGTIGSNAARQRRQIAHARSGEFWLDPGLKQQIEAVAYPAHFADFEVSQLALPYHARMRPYGQVAYQWSSYTISETGAAPVHGEWLNTEYEWPNERFVRSLRAQIGDNGSVLTWSKFERSTLRRVLAELGQFGVTDPGLAAWITDVAERRIVDMHEWATKHFYHPAMGGRTSIKVVFDALWKQDTRMREQFTEWTGRTVGADTDPYAALPPLEIHGVLQDVREGTGAIRAYEAMMYGVEKHDEEAKARWRQLLLQYCALDSISMALIFEHLRRKTAH